MKKFNSRIKLLLLSLLIAGFLSGCVAATVATVAAIKSKKRSPRKLYLSDSVPEIDKTREAKILTAFFGLDNGLTFRARAIYRKAQGKDGMPLVFSHELDPKTLQGADFAVTTKNGTVHIVEAASFLPANEEFELRTVLLIGEYGNHTDNPPVSVEVVGDLMARTGQNFKGQSIKVIPLEEGPILSYAEYFTFDEKYPYIKKGRGCDCPKEETKMIVKVVWAGGVRAVNGKELGDNEKDNFVVTMVNGSDTIKVTPFKLADLGDSENNIDLCIKESGIPILVQVNENIAIDPNNDKNPRTEIKILSRW
jgi:ketosteroid isomerase-like protein